MVKRTKTTFVIAVLLLIAGLFLFWRTSSMGPYGDKATRTELKAPLDRYGERPKLLTFGLYVTPNPDQNPIDPPERFTGYHTALDLEIFPEETGRDVPVYAACNGRVIFRSTAEGYGGVLVQRCTVERQDVTVLYGHIDPGSFTVGLNQNVSQGKQVAILGDNKTAETGDTRKHLHFQIHKGREVELKGYVQDQSSLKNYLDPQPLIR